VDLAPVCRDDLVILPKNVSRKYGGIGPMVLITKISQAIHIVDIKTMQTHEIDKATYWQTQFFNCLGRERLSEFIVMNIENIDNDNNTSKSALRQKLRQVQVEVARKEDFGVNDKTYIINSHLGEILNFNDTVLGYDLVQANISDIDEYNHVDKYLPEIVLVKKTFPKFRKRQRNRIWKLKHFEDKKMEVKTVVEEEEEDDDGEDARNNKPKEKKKTKKQLRRELKEDKDVKKGKDYEHFLQDIEDDPELRSHVNLYKDDDIIG
jgi:nonsense-mediated mRNA decay protein 3